LEDFVEETALLCATNEQFLRQTLQRIDSGAPRQALSDSLPEWQYVDRQAQTWAIRRYRREDAEDDPSSPLSSGRGYSRFDGEAIGLVLNLDKKGLRLKYLSTNRDAEKIAADCWQGFRVKMTGPNVFDISPQRSENNPPSILTLFGAFGHGVYL
jgi:hypothetical protein